MLLFWLSAMESGGPSVALQGSVLQGVVPAPVPKVPPDGFRALTALSMGVKNVFVRGTSTEAFDAKVTSAIWSVPLTKSATKLGTAVCSAVIPPSLPMEPERSRIIDITRLLRVAVATSPRFQVANWGRYFMNVVFIVAVAFTCSDTGVVALPIFQIKVGVGGLDPKFALNMSVARELAVAWPCDRFFTPVRQAASTALDSLALVT